MSEQATCGTGLAEHSALPARLAELITAMASNLEVHIGALDLDDANARAERDVYRDLVRAHREVAEKLEALAAYMAGLRDLPMGRHDTSAMAAPEVARAFEWFVTAKRELLALLEGAGDQDEAMLEQMRALRS